MKEIRLRDNDKRFQDTGIPESLVNLNNKDVKDIIKENSNFFILSNHETEDEIEDKKIFSVWPSNQNTSLIQTYNLMGFIGTKDCHLSITSRFCQGNNKDFFLYYLLEKIFHFNWINSEIPINLHNWFEFLPFLFPLYLNKALSQGLFKKYVITKHNDMNLKGYINIAQQIKSNIPFMGNFYYTTREHNYDNPVIQLIRHTIEYIKNTPWGNIILHSGTETIQNIRTIISITSSYKLADRQKVITHNLKPINSPYFSEYIPLQKLCLSILRRENISYGDDSKAGICGVLFDGAWLWEEYLYSIFKDIGFEHSENLKGTKPHYLFKDKKTYPRYFDLYNEQKRIILDAKYKHLRDKQNDKIDRNDIHQLITYMHIMPADIGCLICPNENETSFTKLGKLNGIGGDVYIGRLQIPQESQNYNNYQDFKNQIIKNEEYLIKKYRETIINT